MKPIVPWRASVLACLMVAGCGQTDELSRESAAEILATHFNTPETGNKGIPLWESGFSEGISQGYWGEDGTLTEKGVKIFEYVDMDDLTFALKTPHTYEIEVTGISGGGDSEAMKLAEFRLSNENLSGPARRFAAPFGTGRAEFRQFDDGWRLENPKQLAVTFERTKQLALSAADKTAAANDVAERQQNYEARLALAQEDTEERVFECTISGAGRVDRRRLKITNAHIYISDPSGTLDRAIWYGSMDRWFQEIVMFKNDLVVIDGDGNRTVAYFSPCKDWVEAIKTLQQQNEAWRGRFPDLIWRPESH